MIFFSLLTLIFEIWLMRFWKLISSFRFKETTDTLTSFRVYICRATLDLRFLLSSVRRVNTFFLLSILSDIEASDYVENDNEERRRRTKTSQKFPEVPRRYRSTSLIIKKWIKVGFNLEESMIIWRVIRNFD